MLIAVDCGKSGGIAWKDNDGNVGVSAMPDTDVGVFELLRDLSNNVSREEIVMIIEKPPKFVKQLPSSRIAVLFEQFGLIKGIALGLRFRIIEVRPQEWLKEIGMKKKKEESRQAWKRRLKDKAQKLYPNIKVSLFTADALLMLEVYKSKF